MHKTTVIHRSNILDQKIYIYTYKDKKIRIQNMILYKEIQGVPYQI